MLERAEKVKSRIEQLGGHVAKAEMGDEGEEVAVLRRGSLINGVAVELWRPPGDRFDAGEWYREAVQPESAAAQLDMDPEWKDIQPSSWQQQASNESDWVMRQGPVSDCSIVAAMGVGVKHGEQFGTAVSFLQGLKLSGFTDCRNSLVGRTYTLKMPTVARDDPKMENMS